MTKEELDNMYDMRLENLYQIAVANKDAGVGMMILDKIRVMKLHMLRPAEDEKSQE